MSTASSRVPEEWSMVNGSDARSAISGVAEAEADDEDVGRGCTYVRTWILWERIVRAEPSREHKRSKALWREHYTRDHFFRFSLSSSLSLSLSLARALSLDREQSRSFESCLAPEALSAGPISYTHGGLRCVATAWMLLCSPRQCTNIPLFPYIKLRTHIIKL